MPYRERPRYATEGPGPRENEIARWEEPRNGRPWITIISFKPGHGDEILHEDGPRDSGHYGHDWGGTSHTIEAFIGMVDGPLDAWIPADAKRKIQQAITEHIGLSWREILIVIGKRR